MTTLDLVSTSADGLRPTDDPLISVRTIVANLGGHPAVTVPMITGAEPDVNCIWDNVAETADFFGIVTPPRNELQAACRRLTSSASSHLAIGTSPSLLVVTIMLIEVDERAQFVVSGAVARRYDPTPVRITVGHAAWSAQRLTDPLWMQLAARTASKGDADRLRRQLSDNGFVDRVASDATSTIGPPALGALVFDEGDGFIGVDDGTATGIIRLLVQCGAIRTGMITGTTEFVNPAHASSVWWISPDFEVHPVDGIGEVRYRAESELAPTFLGPLS